MERFCAKYYLGEDKVTFAKLQMVKQRAGEDPVQFIKRFEDISLDCYRGHEEKELVETCISNMLFEYRLNLENLCITQFANLLQRTRRMALTINMKRVPIPQAMTTLVGENKKKPEGKAAEEPLVIPCTVEELNHVLNKWTGDGIIRLYLIRIALIDTGTSLNLITLSTLEIVGIASKRILGTPMEITGFGRAVQSTEGYPVLETLGSPILEEEEGSNAHDLRDLLDRKRWRKEETSSSRF
nr:hypothetical protein CFP56_49577 [Quercus suber]